MKHIGFFAGEGGFEFAAEQMGWETVAWCEWNLFCQRILKYYFPRAEGFGDIDSTCFKKYANTIDIVTGGFPCQPYSSAGQRKGKDDARHKWPQMLRGLSEIQSPWVVGENVRGLTNWNGGMVFDQVQADLETLGYKVLPFLLPAAGIKAVHRRDRIWFVAYSRHNAERKARSSNHVTGAGFTPLQAQEQSGTRPAVFDNRLCDIHGVFTDEYWQKFPTKSPICSANDGIPRELDGITFSKWRQESIRVHGNAVVPQLVLRIYKAIEQYEKLNPII